jgi:hypothetical protein
MHIPWHEQHLDGGTYIGLCEKNGLLFVFRIPASSSGGVRSAILTKSSTKCVPYHLRSAYMQAAKKSLHHVPENYFFFWFVGLLALRPLLAYCASLG